MTKTRKLSHFDESGASRMVDVGPKQPTRRTARARAAIKMKPDVLRLVQDRKIQKGDVFEVARLAGIMAAKKTSSLIPLCHPLPIENVKIDFRSSDDTIEILAEVRVTAKTGVEMEALTAAAVAALTVYDMCKSAQKDMTITAIELLEKTGGKSGTYKKQKTMERQ
ncbi:MAG: cyclic pyranopterin monophosphate synthase MoaC [Candidatus Abyssobacteria bacterium SURF_5]|uniref:Cyclic pyranopterin monophosphate synthase n=1 Tax=Abyssobacteria bacterium (strain SURF_5) TaxID=2093360 RepID=A0A3A4P5H3_ABYX5|nr:MAG: cyclic pyranopterin monophosphate synthase MoaC [Candidatus Abyssubacteria bacterium SURF_5]